MPPKRGQGAKAPPSEAVTETSAAEIFARWGGNAPFNGDVDEAIRFGDREATLALLRARRLPAERAEGGFPTDSQLENARTASLTAHLATCGMRVQTAGSMHGSKSAAPGDAGGADGTGRGKDAKAEEKAKVKGGSSKGKANAKAKGKHTKPEASGLAADSWYLPEKDRVVEAVRMTVERAHWAEAKRTVTATNVNAVLDSFNQRMRAEFELTKSPAGDRWNMKAKPQQQTADTATAASSLHLSVLRRCARALRGLVHELVRLKGLRGNKGYSTGLLAKTLCVFACDCRSSIAERAAKPGTDWAEAEYRNEPIR